MKGKIIVPLLLASLSAGVVATQQQQNEVFADASTIRNVVSDLVEITDYESMEHWEKMFIYQKQPLMTNWEIQQALH